MTIQGLLFLGFVFAGASWAFVKRAGAWAGWVASVLPFSLFGYFLFLAPTVLAGTPVTDSSEWAPLLGGALSFRLDGLALLFAFLITGVGGLVSVYAGGYLQGHPHLGRFFLFLLLFMCAMLGVVLADNLLALFVFWELTSITSYLLIGFDHEDARSRAAARQGLLVTVGGGQALLAGILLLGMLGGSFELSSLVTQGEAIREHALYLPILVLVLIGALTKSAQFPFHFWLPGAMQAPTPVSAYLHSATMVKAGVFLLARFHPILGDTAIWTSTVTGVGAVTMLAGAFLTLGETDAKRVLAYATVCVLGTLVLLLGIGTPLSVEACLVFLLGHALYKGALFLVAGSLDHGTGTRELPGLGGLFPKMPVTAVAAGLAALSMAGVLPAFGFIGKELVYEAALHSPVQATLLTTATVLAFIPLVTSAARVGFGPFWGERRETPHAPHEAKAGMLLGPLVLGVLGFVFGVAPGLSEPLLTEALQAVHPGEGRVALGLWHGFNPALALSVTSLVGGAVGYRFRAVLWKRLQRLRLGRFGPARGYELALDGLMRVAKAQTKLLQSGYLRVYLFITFFVTGGMTGAVILSRSELRPRLDLSEVRLYEAVLALLILIAAVAAARARTRLGSVAAMGVVGFGVALLFLYFGAPDLALTQAIVEALTVVVFLLAFFHLPRYRDLSTKASRVRDVVICLAFGAVMTTLVLFASQYPLAPLISRYFLEASVPEAHGRNVVNVILVDFRALDTLGEITVLGAASVGVYALLRLRPAKGKAEP